MALIVCPECGKEVSSRANACVHCGFPLSGMEEMEPVQLKVVPVDTQKDEISQLIEEAKQAIDANDYDNSFAIYMQAAELGSSYAQVWVGNHYSRGLGREKDYKQAMAWYEKAAQQNDCHALNNIGSMYQNGEGVPQNLDIAIDYYERAISLGSTTAETNLGVLYNNLAVRYIDGDGVVVDYDRAE